MRRRLLTVTVACVLAFAAGLVQPGAPASATTENVRWAPGAHWEQRYIDAPGGVTLHADVLRPAHLSLTAKTPVILSVGPYFNHSGSGGVFGALDGFEYNPVSPAGPNSRFADLVTGGQLMERGYTFVMVDLRGFGASTGCLDYYGPGEKADVRTAITWAATQPWSTGAVGMYGKSYDGGTGVVGAALAPRGLRAVVAGEPIYDGYRYLYQNGVRYLNSWYMSSWYNQIASAPGSLGDDPRYSRAATFEAAHPQCLTDNARSQVFNTDHRSAYWRARDSAGAAHDSSVPLFVTQGLIENNTWPDGLSETIAGRRASTRAWLGMWDHVRGNEIDEKSGRLAMGRAGWFDEVMRWFDKYLKGIDSKADPAVVVEDNTGHWREQASWPTPTSASTVALPTGSYLDSGTAIGSYGTQKPTIKALVVLDRNPGLWRISRPVRTPVRISGVPHVTARTTVSGAGPRTAQMVVDLYDIPPAGSATRITRAATVLPAGSRTTHLDLLPTDWLLAPGHRLGVRVVNTNSELYLPSGSGATVRVTGGTVSVPLDGHSRAAARGDRSVYLDTYESGAGRYDLPVRVGPGSFTVDD